MPLILRTVSTAFVPPLRFLLRLPSLLSLLCVTTSVQVLLQRRLQVLVQGVIDCVIEDSEGELHLVDYKTDRLTPAEIADPKKAAEKLCGRHRLQLSYYAAACEGMYGKPPKEILIYSLPLGDAIPVTVERIGGNS